MRGTRRLLITPALTLSKRLMQRFYFFLHLAILHYNIKYMRIYLVWYGCLNYSTINKNLQSWGNRSKRFKIPTGFLPSFIVINYFIYYTYIYIDCNTHTHIYIYIYIFFFCRHLMGDSLSALSVKELKQVENRLEKAISRIRSKKVCSYNIS